MQQTKPRVQICSKEHFDVSDRVGLGQVDLDPVEVVLSTPEAAAQTAQLAVDGVVDQVGCGPNTS
jgi:hypothetical protein